MNKLIRYAIIPLSMIYTLPSSAAAYTTPTGIWDIYSNINVTINTATASQTDQINKILTQALYFDTFNYKSYDWSGVPGTWQKGSGNTIQTLLQVNKVPSTGSVPVYLNRLVKDFSNYISKTSGVTPVISAITLQYYNDNATLDSAGLSLNGTTSSAAIINYQVPGSQASTTAKLKVTGNYQGVRASAPSTCCTSDDPTVNLTQSGKFLVNNSQLSGVSTTASGLQYKVVYKAKGDVRKPKATDTVQVSYRGYLPSGQVFDANSGISFKLNQVISGWTEGLQLMSAGDYFRFYIPPNLAYGNRSAGGYIKPNSALVFDVILQSIQ